MTDLAAIALLPTPFAPLDHLARALGTEARLSVKAKKKLGEQIQTRAFEIGTISPASPSAATRPASSPCSSPTQWNTARIAS